MTDAEQLALPGLAPRKRKSRARVKQPAALLPIARVVLDVQATQLGQLFDYLVEERFSDAARPGTLVRVRFGGKLVDAIVWERRATSDTDATALRYVERVLSDAVLVPRQMRRDITAIADAYGGTRANIVRVAVAPRVAWVEQRLGPLIERVDALESAAMGSGSAAAVSAGSPARGSLAAGSVATGSADAVDFPDNALGAATLPADRLTHAQALLQRECARYALAYDEGRALLDALRHRQPVDEHGGGDASAGEGRAAGSDAVSDAGQERGAGHDGGAGQQSGEGVGRCRSFVVDAAPGAFMWARDLACMVIQAWMAGRSVAVVLPTQRETFDLMHALTQYGLRAFSPDDLTADDAAMQQGSGEHEGESEGTLRQRLEELGDVAMLTTALSPAQRYASYLAVASGLVRIAIGTRATMYAPVADDALFVIVDDAAYQNADGFMPYANARGVMHVRSMMHGGVFVAMAMARSVLSQYECEPSCTVAATVSGPATSVHPTKDCVQSLLPVVRWLSREELLRLGDASVGARMPHTAVTLLRKALETGPVLLSIPHDGLADTLSCASCLTQARCRRCQGPLESRPHEAPRCRWCGAPATDWQCAQCQGTRLRTIRVGAAGTIEELQGLFRGVPLLVSNARLPGGPLVWVEDEPAIIVATEGSEPMVRGDGHNAGMYAASAVLDAWTSLYRPGIDARIDVLGQWMRVASMTAPAVRGGTMLVIGQSDAVVAQSLMLWDSRMLAARECEERSEAVLPPAVSAACVWGRRDAVQTCLRTIGVLSGDWAQVAGPDGAVPAVLGPVGIPAQATVDARELENMGDRVKAVVRVPHERRAELALRLRQESARHMAMREPGELRFQLDPKDLV
ncbi:primosomal protein N' [Bifidobacterium gallicum]|nr:primosomal protein N' [Bifidobacterium gallicum]